MMDNESFDDPREELISVISTEMGRIRDALNEIKVQIEQTEKVVNTEQQRNADIATELRTVQDNIDTIPRQDIRAKYDEALDARFRLSTMRGQLEKFQSNRETLEQQQVLLSKLLNKIQGVDVFHDDEDDNSIPGTPVTAVNIVRIVQAQEEERQRLARQMHDGPAQSLTNFILQAEICQRLFDRNPERAAEELDNLKTNAGITFQKVRDFIFDLRPMMLDDLGVVPTVRRYVESFNEKSGIETGLELMGEERRLEAHREVMIFRGIQELLVNARDYAAPSKISIRLDMGNERIRADIEDNGRGFDTQAAFSSMNDSTSDPRTQSMITLRETFELVGGILTISSSETDGTSARIELPAESNRY